MTRKMSEIYVHALVLAQSSVCATIRGEKCRYDPKEDTLCGPIYRVNRVIARLLDRMMARPTRSVAEICKRHGLTQQANNSEVELTKRFESDLDEGRK